MTKDNLFVVGNDIVDLKVKEPSLHRRYNEKVFSEEERRQIGNNLTFLWLHWAAKEAAFKVISQIERESTFRPKDFYYQVKHNAIFYGSKKLYCQSVITKEFVHVCCTAQPKRLWTNSFKRWVIKLNPSLFRRSLKDPFVSSSEIRKTASLRIAKLLKIDPARLSFISYCDQRSNVFGSPPYLLIDGKLSSHSVSFSHHGRFLAIAFEPNERQAVAVNFRDIFSPPVKLINNQPEERHL